MSVKIGNIDLGILLTIAPMEDVGDPHFARCASATELMSCTRFISSEGLIRDAVEYSKIGFFDYERPLAIQIFERYRVHKQTTKICEKVNPDFIDINMVVR